MPTGLIQKYTMKNMEHYGNNDPNYVKEPAALYDPYYDVGEYLKLVRNIFQHLIEYKDILPDSLEEAYKKLVERITPLLLIETYKFFGRFINKEPELREYYYVCGKSQEYV
jgi:hypothetical protein